MLDDSEVMLELNETLNATISQTSHRLFQYNFSDTDEDVLLKIERIDNGGRILSCSLVSVQPINKDNKQVNILFNFTNKLIKP